MKKEDSEKIDFRYNLKVYFDIVKKYKLMILALILLIIVGESVGVLNKFLFKIVADRGAEFFSGELMRDGFVNSLLVVAAVFIVSVFLGSVSNWFYIHIINRIEGNSIADLKRKFFTYIIHLHYGFHTSNKTGSLISRLIRGGGAMERLTDVLVFNFIPLIFSVILVGGAIFYFDPVSAVVLLATIIVFIGYSVIIEEMQKKYSILANDSDDMEKGSISDIFTNIDSIKHFGKENRVKALYRKLSETTKLNAIKNWDFYNWMSSGQRFIIGIGTFFLIYFSINKFLDGNLTVGTLVFLYTSFIGLTGPLHMFVNGIRGFYRSMAAFQSLFKYGKIENEIKDRLNAKKLVIKRGAIEFRGLSFGYKNNLFSNFNLDIPEGKRIALVGHSGSGKTTLVRLLYRLYDVKKGEILIDGKNINEFQQESLRSELSIVPQECVLFDDTIYNNILFSNTNAKRGAVIKAMKSAQLYSIVNTFPNREKTIVGERGVKLSGGEKQRVSIARAILADKRVLVLDEPTSSLDSKTESEIQNALNILMKDRTTIIIAHRLSTIMNSDLIVVMEKGKIVQKGTHSQLIKKKGVYKELWELQKGGYIR